MYKKQLLLAITAAALSTAAFASDHGHAEHASAATAETCTGFGPQTPRDIDSRKGDNKRTFSMAPDYKKMNLCNIHFHVNAEHKAKDFSIHAEGEHGAEGGYQCNMSKHLSAAELAPTAAPICKSEHGELKAGDTIEVHWVHSSCDVKPGKGLGSCLSASCANPDLRVETQVFTLVNDANALDFNTLSYDGQMVNGFHQAKALPSNTGKPVEFMGSTTGPKYTEQACSPLQVTWSVRPQCAKVNINTVGKWCEKNVFEEDHAHGVRKLVTSPQLLSGIK
ncbi:MAG: delta-class carbonic anhydrase [Gallionella sp.]|nr:delta-class carbonic anhydrase [Gallionella sp.]